MKGQDRTFCELTTDPRIQLLAILSGIVVLFFFCMTRVQASLPASSSFDASAKETETLPVNSKIPDNRLNPQAKYFDYSDISNERAGASPESINPKQLKGTVHSEARRSLLARIMGLFSSSLGASLLAPSQANHL